jgi:MoaA/NifB/PqqE/SkfB family radical SAM enzyme
MGREEVSFHSLEIKANYSCNAGCDYCCAGNVKSRRSMSFEEITSNVRFFIREYGIGEVCLSGGEPTVHPSFSASLRFIRSQGLKTYLHTNAIRFADPGFAESVSTCIDRALTGFSFHDALSCGHITGSTRNYELRKRGIGNLLALSVPLRTNTVIVRGNFRHLPEISRTIEALGVGKALFTFPFFFEVTEGQVERFTPPSFSEVKPYLKESFDFLTGAGIPVYLQGVPPCRLEEFESYREIDPDRAFVDSSRQLGGHSFLFSGMLGYARNENCADCGYGSECWGFPLPGALGGLGREMALPG